MNSTLGPYEAKLLAYAHMRKIQTLKVGDVAHALRITAKQETQLLSRLVRVKMIARVRRGLYLIPPRLPLGGQWSPSEGLALNTLMEDQGAKYQICGPSAFNRYGFDEQIPNRIYAYNNRISGERKIGSVSVTLIRVSNQRLGGTDEVENEDNIITVYSSRARTLVDAVYDWSRFNTLPRAYTWIKNELAAKRVTAGELINATLRYGDKGTVRRIGLLLEMIGTQEQLLMKLLRALAPSKALIPWVPVFANRGKKNGKWGVLENHLND
jgi:predicted transcriptional regulator of viral defense system